MPRNIVICCDGTWNTKDQAFPTNVTKLHAAVKAAADTAQAVTYIPGIDTDHGLIGKLFGGPFSHGLVDNIKGSYGFLVENYQPGDNVFLFGFSRGAYTARSVAGLIRNCGVLQRPHSDMLQPAINMYRSRDHHPNSEVARTFRETNSHEVGVHFIGVWDTVGALGIPLRGLNLLTQRKHLFHDDKLSSSVKHAYQALAIDERRWSFKPAAWEDRTDITAEAKAAQAVEQAWFAGVHTDVGGGQAVAGLSDLALRWMLVKAEAAGLAYDHAYIDRTSEPDPLSMLHESRTGFYKYLWPHNRPIAGNRAGETVNAAPIERNEKDPSYRPSNLQSWLSSHPTP